MLLWSIIASPAASIIFGIAVLVGIYKTGAHRPNGVLNRAIPVEAFLVGISLYTFSIVLLGQFYLHIPAAKTIGEDFGDARLSWLLMGIAADNFVRLHGIFYPN